MLVVCFSVELIFNILISVNMDEIFDFENFLLIIYNYELLWAILGKRPYDLLFFLNVSFLSEIIKISH
jgi:hypothetical protein